MRVISGTARGTVLTAPKGLDTRPTADLVKGALFDVLGENVRESAFLDLFAGTGAIGIEALSRGASSAVFADTDRLCADIIRKNAEKTHLSPKARVLRQDALTAVKTLSAERRRFDFIFLDPPYGQNKEFFEQLLTKFIECDIMEYNCIVIIERQKKETNLDFSGFENIKTRVYSNAKLEFFARVNYEGNV